MPTTTIHVPMSLNRQFATQACLLVRSIARRSGLGKDWQVVLTLSRDTDLTLDTPLLAWMRDFPVRAQWVDATDWRRWSGADLRLHIDPGDADVLLLMDADTVVVGSLAEVVAATAAERVIAGWPAWQPPEGIDIDRALRECGAVERGRDLTYSGHGLAFLAPRHCPPYFNLGFVAINGALARDMAQTLPADFEDVNARFTNCYNSQLAICVNILRHGYPFRALDMRYNASNGDWDPPPVPPFEGEEFPAALAAAHACLADARVLHYCVPAKGFSRGVDMDGMDRVRDFCRRTGLDSGGMRLQEALSPLLADDA